MNSYSKSAADGHHESPSLHFLHVIIMVTSLLYSKNRGYYQKMLCKSIDKSINCNYYNYR